MTRNRRDPTRYCAGPGRCHGCLKWCDRCGDVADVCNAKECHEHPDCGRFARAEFEVWWRWMRRPKEIGRSTVGPHYEAALAAAKAEDPLAHREMWRMRSYPGMPVRTARIRRNEFPDLPSMDHPRLDPRRLP